MKIVGICGSIRENSSNWLILKTAKTYLNQHDWAFADLSILPYFQPELQFQDTPEIVHHLRNLASAADLILISTPEYAHGIPGILKNGLEWLFCEGTMKKPVALIIGSSQGEHVKDQLLEVLRTMDFQIDLQNTLIVQGARTRFTEDGKILDSQFASSFHSFLDLITQE